MKNYIPYVEEPKGKIQHIQKQRWKQKKRTNQNPVGKINNRLGISEGKISEFEDHGNGNQPK